MRKTLFLLITLGIITGAFFSHSLSANENYSSKQVLSAQTVSEKKTVSQIPSASVSPGIPETISIPKINVHTKIESVGMDSQGRMDVPKDPFDTGWFSPGYKPGMNGSAVIDGHLDLVTGAPAAFWNLKLLSVGDTISVTENNGRTYTFAVDQVVKYPYNNFPIDQVFAASNVPRLNLVTCNGTWDRASKNYSDRLVVYSKLVSQN
jgi:sortase (surface protein transpeptidase)